jgi:DNA-binding MarR family transcriptional regulator
VSLPQLRVLVILASRGPQSPNSVARQLEIHPSNATRACDKLADSGLLTRHEDPDDRRLLQLTLTRRAEHLLEKIMDHRLQQISQLLAQVPPRAQATLLRTQDSRRRRQGDARPRGMAIRMAHTELLA